MDFPNLVQDSPYYEAVESIISSIDSRLFVIFPSLFCPILYYDWPFRESLFFFRGFFVLVLYLCIWASLMVNLFLVFILLSHQSLSLSFRNILRYSEFLPLVLFLLLCVTSFFLKLLGEFQFVPFRLKTADVLFLGRDDAYIRSVISDLSVNDERIRVLESVLLRRALLRFLLRRRALELETPYSRASVIGGIKFNLSDFGELQTARRLWRDYSARRGAVVYVVNVDTGLIWEAREDLNNLLYDEDFEMVPFLILCMTANLSASEEELCILLEERSCNLLGLTNMTTGKGRVNLAGRNTRALEVFVSNVFNGRHLDAIEWLAQYIDL